MSSVRCKGTAATILQIAGASFDLTWEKGFEMKTVEQTVVSSYSGKLAGNTQSNSGLIHFLASSILRGYINKAVDGINNTSLFNPGILVPTFMERNPMGY
ncbi:MAG: hypothetical protein MK202_06565 [Tenacibaculum sp.]|nr:hypothetical protein [Tenacibaculum sp.]